MGRDLQRAHVLDLTLQKKRLVLGALVLLGSLVVSAKNTGWFPVVLMAAMPPLAVGAVHIARRLGLSNWSLVIPLSWSCTVFGAIIALTGGARSPCAGFLIMSTIIAIGVFPRERHGLVCAVEVVAWLTACTLYNPRDLFADTQFVLIPAATIRACALADSTLSFQALDQRRKAVLDPLTGAFNRSSLTVRLGEMLVAAARTDAEVSVVMGDIDRFKLVNDQYGHGTGDEVLKAVAYALRKGVRTFDPVYRLGGEEFVVLLPGVGQQEAGRAAERLRERISELDDCGVHVTMSFGVAGGLAKGVVQEALLFDADTALYRAKREGRDCVVTAGD